MPQPGYLNIPLLYFTSNALVNAVDHPIYGLFMQVLKTKTLSSVSWHFD